MNSKHIETLVKAIGFYHRVHEPASPAYQLNNPLMTRSFARPGKHEVNEEGLRIYPSIVDGFKACLYDMDRKVQGTSRAGIKTEDCLVNLLRVYGLSDPAAQEIVVKFLRKALNDVDLNKNTPLEYFR